MQAQTKKLHKHGNSISERCEDTHREIIRFHKNSIRAKWAFNEGAETWPRVVHLSIDRESRINKYMGDPAQSVKTTREWIDKETRIGGQGGLRSLRTVFESHYETNLFKSDTRSGSASWSRRRRRRRHLRDTYA